VWWVTNHFIDWSDPVLAKEETSYDKYHKVPDVFKATFVGPVRTWGGKRKGAGRPKMIKKQMVEGLTVVVKLNNIQLLSLKEMGNGSLNAGVQALIDQHL
jgi:hypothetical protein